MSGTATLGSASRSPLFPPLSTATLVTLLIAGVAADVTWEIWARFITPFWVGGPLQPAALVQSVFGLQSWTVAEIIHIVVGVVFYPIGYLFIARPIADALARAAGLERMPWVVTGLGFGIGLWVFALYVMAHLFAGLPPFLGFITLTWASLVGHVIFGLIVATVVAARRA